MIESAFRTASVESIASTDALKTQQAVRDSMMHRNFSTLRELQFVFYCPVDTIAPSSFIK